MRIFSKSNDLRKSATNLNQTPKHNINIAFSRIVRTNDGLKVLSGSLVVRASTVLLPLQREITPSVRRTKMINKEQKIRTSQNQNPSLVIPCSLYMPPGDEVHSPPFILTSGQYLLRSAFKSASRLSTSSRVVASPSHHCGQPFCAYWGQRPSANKHFERKKILPRRLNRQE
jgi:hypothetical protein